MVVFQLRKTTATGQTQLVDGLLPQVPYRQVVFTFPVPLRLAMFRQPSVLSLVLQRAVRALFARLRRRAQAPGGDVSVGEAFTPAQPQELCCLSEGESLCWHAEASW